MSKRIPFDTPLPSAAAPAVAIVRRLREKGFEAMLAGGCVRDLLLGREPQDYDVATAARPEDVLRLFRGGRKVGVQFGVVLVKQHGRWVEVATFRADGPYIDGRRPLSVTYTDARKDAMRRDFTINGMFIDPLDGFVLDYVGGRDDIAARQIRAIGDPEKRFAEDHLRLLRAVRFAAKLAFTIAPHTRDAVERLAPHLKSVAPERIREELEKMLSDENRTRAFRLLAETDLLSYLWRGARFLPEQIARIETELSRLDANASFAVAFAAMLGDQPPRTIEEISRLLTLSNEQRETVVWLVQNRAALDAPEASELATLKRLMASPAMPDLLAQTAARMRGEPDGVARWSRLAARLRAIPPESVQPPPLVRGDDVLERGIPAGPIFRQVLDALYTRQLNEEFATRDEALRALEALLVNRRADR